MDIRRDPAYISIAIRGIGGQRDIARLHMEESPRIAGSEEEPMSTRFSKSVSALGCVLWLASAALADVSFSASEGNLAASANFSASGPTLTITLTNTSAFDVLVPADVLTALFFDCDGPALNLTPVSAILNGGSVVHFDAPPPAGNVGGEWEWEESFSNPAPQGAAYGISSSGFTLFGSGEMFGPGDLDPPTNVDGLNYGITSAGDNTATGNAPVTGGVPLIQNSVVFTLTGLPGDFDESCINNVNWQYGTGLDEPNIPEPAAVILLSLGALALRRR